MAFTYTRSKTIALGPGARMSWGTFTNAAADTGGDIATGLRTISHFHGAVTSHVDGGAVKHSTSTGTATVVTGAGVDGQWMAIGS